MKNCMRALTLPLLLLATLGASSAHAEGSVHVLFPGLASFHDSKWTDSGTAGLVGLTGSFAGKKWPVHLDVSVRSVSSIDLFASSDLSATEWGVGVWRAFGRERKARPFLGGGVALVSASGHVTVPGASNNLRLRDQSFGAYVDGGVAWRLGEHFDIGLDVHFLQGTSFEGVNTGGGNVSANANYGSLAMILGWGW